MCRFSASPPFPSLSLQEGVAALMAPDVATGLPALNVTLVGADFAKNIRKVKDALPAGPWRGARKILDAYSVA